MLPSETHRAPGGGSRTRTYEGLRQGIYSPPPLPLGTFPQARDGVPKPAAFIRFDDQRQALNFELEQKLLGPVTDDAKSSAGRPRNPWGPKSERVL